MSTQTLSAREVLHVCRVRHGSAPGADHAIVQGQRSDHVAFPFPEPLLPVIAEYFGDRAAAFLFDEGIGIKERHV